MSLSVTKMQAHAIDLAEAVHNRAHWLARVKDMRRRQRTETVEGYAVTLNAYRSAKRMGREALERYNAARAKVDSGNDPGHLDEDAAARLRMYGWDI